MLPDSRLARMYSLYQGARLVTPTSPTSLRGRLDRTALPPHALLMPSCRSRAGAGRLRDFPNAPGTLDLDLSGTVTRSVPSLHLPSRTAHARTRFRAGAEC